MTGALVVQADALRLPLPDESVDLIVTSPPYFALRAYDAGPAQIGSEPTPADYLEALWAATAEMVRVLKPSGSIFCDLGDKYGRPGGGADVAERTLNGAGRGTTKRLATPAGVGRDKSLLGLPEAYRLGCSGMLAYLGGPDPGLGLIARAVIVWDKPNGLPESVQDRVRRSHEDWVHLVKQPRYYSAVDEVREAPAANYHDRPQYQRAMQLFHQAGLTDAHMAAVRAVGVIDSGAGQVRSGGSWDSESGKLALEVRDRLGSYYRELCGSNTEPKGKLPGSVWQIPSEPLRLPGWLGVDHYAAFPTEWPRRLILGWSPPGICVDCGQGRVPVVERGEPQQAGHGGTEVGDSVRNGHGWASEHSTLRTVREATILGYACACTPCTDHPGSGGPRQVDYDVGLENGQYANTAMGLGHAGGRPRLSGWREYHLQGWTPPPTRPAIVADVFGGTGTTAMVARALGRIGLSFDLSHAYSRAARWRIWSDDAAKAISRTNLERQGSLLWPSVTTTTREESPSPSTIPPPDAKTPGGTELPGDRLRSPSSAAPTTPGVGRRAASRVSTASPAPTPPPSTPTSSTSTPPGSGGPTPTTAPTSTTHTPPTASVTTPIAPDPPAHRERERQRRLALERQGSLL